MPIERMLLITIQKIIEVRRINLQFIIKLRSLRGLSII